MSNRLSSKTQNKKVLAQKINESKQLTEIMEAALNCLAATVWRNFPTFTKEDVKKDGAEYFPLFEIHGIGDVGLRNRNHYVLVKDKLTIKDKIRNLINGYQTTGFTREAGRGIFGIRGLLARLRGAKKDDSQHEEVRVPESGKPQYTPATGSGIPA